MRASNFIYEFRIKRVRRSTAAEKVGVYSLLHGPDKVASVARHLLKGEARECFLVFIVDIQNRVIGYEVVAIGNLTGVDVHPREVFRSAILGSAAAVILVHNHPSGNPTLSAEDIDLTKRMDSAGEILGIPVLDHIVVSESSHTSYYEHMCSRENQ